MKISSAIGYRSCLASFGIRRRLFQSIQFQHHVSVTRSYATGPSTFKPAPKAKHVKPGSQMETKKASKELEDRIAAIPIENYRNFSIVAHVVS